MIESVASSSSLVADLPEIVPLFPLENVLLLPHARLPLNVFEPRYLKLVEEALGRRDRIIGIIQPSGESGEPQPLYRVGCAGRIVSFSETDDNRYLLTLHGVCRFALVSEIDPADFYRQARVSWDSYQSDLRPLENADVDKERLFGVLHTYFASQGAAPEWESLEMAATNDLISSLAMACPLPSNEKQALLEAPSLRARADMLMTMLEMACLSSDGDEGARH